MHRGLSRRALACGAATIALCSAASFTTAAWAETTGGIETVIVTATKRAENLQVVPAAISAYTAEDREIRGLTSAQQQLDFTPGVQYAPSNNTVTIRGVGRSGAVGLGIDNGVAVYQDGFYVQSSEALSASTLGTDRVEVLRGPQGTLYGRNSIGGALNVISRHPTDKFELEGRTSLNNFGGWTAEGRIAGPVDDWLRLGAMINYSDQSNGWYKNTAGGPDEGGVGHFWHIEGQAAFDVIPEKLEGWIRYQYDESFSRPRDSTSDQPYPVYDKRFAFPYILWGLGTPNPWFGLDPNSNPGFHNHREFAVDTPTSDRLPEQHTLIGDMIWHADGFDVKYTGGYQKNATFIRADGDASAQMNIKYPVNFNAYYGLLGGAFPGINYNSNGHQINVNDFLNFDSDPSTVPTDPSNPNAPGVEPMYMNAYNHLFLDVNSKHRAWSHEIDITSTDPGPFQWVAGAYYYDEHDFQELAFREPCKNATLIADAQIQGGPTPGFRSAACESELLNVTGGYSPSATQIAADPGLLLTPNPLTFFDPLNHSFGATANNQVGDIFRYTGDLKTQSWAVFGQVDYDIDPEWHLTGGLRYSKDTKHGFETENYAFVTYLGLTPGFQAVNPFGFLYAPITKPESIPFVSCAVARAGLDPRISAPIPGVTTGAYDLDPPFKCPIARDLKKSFDALSGTASLKWTPTEGQMYYAKYDRGYKSGGFNLGLFLPVPVVEPEHVNAFEIGTKQNLLDNLQFNAAAFYYDYTNVQVQRSLFGPNATAFAVTALINVPQSHTDGIELETVWQALDQLTIFGNYSYIEAIADANPPEDPVEQHPGLIDIANPLAVGPGAKPIPGQCVNLGTANGRCYQTIVGNSLPGAPHHKFSISATYTTPFANGVFAFTPTLDWHSKSYSQLFNTNEWLVKDGTQVDLSAVWRDNDSGFSILGTVTNLFDREIMNRRSTLGSSNAFFSSIYLNPPRIAKIEIQYKY